MRFCLACLTESYSFAMTVKTYDVTSQPRPQGFSLKKWVGPFSKGKARGTRLVISLTRDEVSPGAVQVWMG